MVASRATVMGSIVMRSATRRSSIGVFTWAAIIAISLRSPAVWRGYVIGVKMAAKIAQSRRPVGPEWQAIRHDGPQPALVLVGRSDMRIESHPAPVHGPMRPTA